MLQGLLMAEAVLRDEEGRYRTTLAWTWLEEEHVYAAWKQVPGINQWTRVRALDAVNAERVGAMVVTAINFGNAVVAALETQAHR